jgi:hypothetical protein
MKHRAGDAAKDPGAALSMHPARGVGAARLNTAGGNDCGCRFDGNSRLSEIWFRFSFEPARRIAAN